jgi:hypothetical protein
MQGCITIIISHVGGRERRTYPVMAVGRANPLHPSDVVVFNANSCEMTNRLAIGTVSSAS